MRRIASGRCTPFLGAGACAGVLPLGSEIARQWSSECDYPFENEYDLASVAQYMSVIVDSMEPKDKIVTLLQQIGPPPQAQDEIHSVLASLPLPLYITTNYDSFMHQALNAVGRQARQEVCRWNAFLRDPDQQEELDEPIPASLFEDPSYRPTPASPLVFHLHGHLGIQRSLVISEDDYLEFLVDNAQEQLLPRKVEAAFTNSSLLFIGYRIADWNFRVLFHSLQRQLGNNLQRSHVSVQLEPGGPSFTPDKQRRAQIYLEKYFGKKNIQIFWGDVHTFASQLSEHWRLYEASQNRSAVA
jgi:SIR2-like protein